MNNIFDFIKTAIVVVTTTISVLNPFNAPSQNTPPIEPTPTSVQGYIDTSSVNPQNQQEGNSPPQQVVEGTKTKAPSNLKPTNDPDPLITCNSKTGKITVRLSVCKSYTDCPDGNGGYVFESQESCKNRWQKFGNQLKNTTDEYVKALKEQSALNSMKLQQDQQRFNNELNERMRQQANETDQYIKDLENKSAVEYQKILDQQREDFKNFIKTPTPVPTSAPAFPPSGCVGVGCL